MNKNTEIVLTNVISTLERTVLRARRGARAKNRIPSIAGVAVVVLALLVVAKPPPVGVEHDLALLSRASLAGVALLNGDLGMVLRVDAAGR